MAHDMMNRHQGGTTKLGTWHFVLAGLLAFSALPVLAQSDYPTRPVRIVVPYPAAGSTDNIARPLAERLSRALGQQFAIENRGGAGGTLGAEVMAKPIAKRIAAQTLVYADIIKTAKVQVE